MKNLDIESNNLELDLKELYNPYDLILEQFNENTESKTYKACSFSIKSKSIIFRKANITPTKVGQFVAIWKRATDGTTQPYQDIDTLDYMIISVDTHTNKGQFIFPKNVLIEKGIITSEVKPGKRGIRVYPPWEVPTSKQALKTQQWQLNYFLDLNNVDLNTQKAIKKALL